MNKYLKVFATAFLIFAVTILIAIIPNRGLWIFYGDFNVQTIPFYVHLHDAIRSGNLLYDWSTDLGGSLVGCYSFYILGSPFFWLSIPFPSHIVPYLIPWINCLKYATMAVTAYAYMRRHLKTDTASFAGAMMYAFSGYAGAVLVYNHFHDVMAFFPLFLLFFEEAMEESKKVRFILITALMVIINYYFFVGEVVFLVLYFISKYFDIKSFKNTLLRAGRAFLCGLTGLLLACVYLLPAIYYTTGNARLSNVLEGNSLLAYDEPTMLLAIIKNTVMMPDISGLNSMFNESYSRVSGVAGYLPLLSVSFVIAFFYINKKHWGKRMITLCALFAAVPALNALFSALNSEYYARWFFMPILVMAYLSADVLENLDKDTMPYIAKGTYITMGLNVAMWLFAALPAKNSDDEWTMLGNIKNPDLLLTEIVFSAFTMLIMFLMVKVIVPGMLNKDESEEKENVSPETEEPEDALISRTPADRAKWLFSALITLTAFILSAIMMISGELCIERERKDGYIDQMLANDTKMEFPDARFFRIETDEDVYNYPMFWSIPSITSFISTIPSSTIEFYDGVGIGRKVTSKLSESKIGTRTLLSGKYYLVESDKSVGIETIGHIDNPESLKGYSYCGEMNGFDVYKNEYFVPMGFYFDYCISEEDYTQNEATQASLDKMLLYSIILNDEDMEKYGDLMERVTRDSIPSLSYFDVAGLSDTLRSHAGGSFKWNTHGFVSIMDMPSDELVFYSVPYEKGFTAYVDDVETEIVKADFGFMAVKVPVGYHRIEFKYVPGNLKEGAILSAIGLFLLIIIAVFQIAVRAKEKADK